MHDRDLPVLTVITHTVELLYFLSRRGSIRSIFPTLEMVQSNLTSTGVELPEKALKESYELMQLAMTNPQKFAARRVLENAAIAIIRTRDRMIQRKTPPRPHNPNATKIFDHLLGTPQKPHGTFAPQGRPTTKRDRNRMRRKRRP
jgi:hypothetical protein